VGGLFCSHKDWHLEAGLAVGMLLLIFSSSPLSLISLSLFPVFIEDPKEQRHGPNAIRPSEDWQALCPIYFGLDPEVSFLFIFR